MKIKLPNTLEQLENLYHQMIQILVETRDVSIGEDGTPYWSYNGKSLFDTEVNRIGKGSVSKTDAG